MSESDKFDFDSLMDDDSTDSGDDFFLFDSEPEKKGAVDDTDFPLDDITPGEPASEPEPYSPKRSSADFSPDMDALLLTAQSSMIVEAMRFISQHDFKSKNATIFSEAIKGIDLYIKILERNPENFRKLTSILSSDQDCMDVQKISFNLFKNVTGEYPETDSQKLKAFEIIKERLINAYNKSLIATSIITIKKYFLLSGSLDTRKVNDEYQKDFANLKKQISMYIQHVNIGRQLIKAGNSELIKGMKGKEMNVFIVKATQLLHHYFTLTGETEYQTFYKKLHENFKRYFVVR